MMKQFFCAVLAAAKELSVLVRVWLAAGASLLAAFALVGMVKTAQYWFPVLGFGVLTVAAVYLYRSYQKRIPIERKAQVIPAVCTAAACSLRRMPYAFDLVQPEDIMRTAQIIRISGADVVTVRLLILEKNVEEIDMGLLRHVFAERLARFGEKPGNPSCAYRVDIPLLALVGIELIGRELLLQVVFADTRAAVLYCKEQRTQEEEQRRQTLSAHPPRLQKQEHIPTLTEADFL